MNFVLSYKKLNLFIRNNAWYLVPRPKDQNVIGQNEFIRQMGIES